MFVTTSGPEIVPPVTLTRLARYEQVVFSCLWRTLETFGPEIGRTASMPVVGLRAPRLTPRVSPSIKVSERLVLESGRLTASETIPTPCAMVFSGVRGAQTPVSLAFLPHGKASHDAIDLSRFRSVLRFAYATTAREAASRQYCILRPSHFRSAYGMLRSRAIELGLGE
ncbi:hypothetical protein KC325_g274 [Hortaea werneckii]|nr:hypothetical protein KC325_g274 [Hortaea werneckii]